MPTSRVILVLYAFVATVNVMASGAGKSTLDWATKPLLMPLLAGIIYFAAREGGPSRNPSRLMLVGLAFATAGDVALMADGDVAFYIGMAAFAGCHGCYIAAFARAGAWRRLRRAPLVTVPIAYAAVVTAAVVWLQTLPIPVIVYGVLLAVMATSAAGINWRTGLGGLLFLVSDLLICVDITDAVALPGPPIWVMLTYTLGQALIVMGWITRTEAPRIPRQRPGSLEKVGPQGLQDGVVESEPVA